MKVILCVVALVLMASGCVSDNSQRKVTMAEVLQEAAPQVKQHPCGVALVWDKKIYENDYLVVKNRTTVHQPCADEPEDASVSEEADNE